MRAPLSPVQQLVRLPFLFPLSFPFFPFNPERGLVVFLRLIKTTSIRKLAIDVHTFARYTLRKERITLLFPERRRDGKNNQDAQAKNTIEIFPPPKFSKSNRAIRKQNWKLKFPHDRSIIIITDNNSRSSSISIAIQLYRYY